MCHPCRTWPVGSQAVRSRDDHLDRLLSEVARAQRFYEGVLGLKCSYDFRGEWVGYDGDS